MGGFGTDKMSSVELEDTKESPGQFVTKVDTPKQP